MYEIKEGSQTWRWMYIWGKRMWHGREEVQSVCDTVSDCAVGFGRFLCLALAIASALCGIVLIFIGAIFGHGFDTDILTLSELIVFTTLMAAGAMAAAVPAAIAVTFTLGRIELLVKKLYKLVKSQGTQKPVKSKESGLMRAWVDSKKDKWCPNIVVKPTKDRG